MQPGLAVVVLARKYSERFFEPRSAVFCALAGARPKGRVDFKELSLSLIRWAGKVHKILQLKEKALFL